MKQLVNKVYEQLFVKKPRYFILMGGRGAGRSTVASQYANAKLIAPQYFRCAIMRYILGDIRNSIYREITDRADENSVTDALSINDGTMTIEHGANSINAVGFKKSSSDQKSKLKSLANYNCVIIEEADEIPEEDFIQLDDSLRTIKGDIIIILLLNCPPKSHWIIRRWFDLDPSDAAGFFEPKLKAGISDTVFIRTSYKDNQKNLSLATISNYERYRETKPAHYWGMIRGLVPEVVQGRIYSGWRMVDNVPHEARLLGYGLDFGFDPDPAAIVAIYWYNGGFVFDEKLYQTQLLNDQLAATFKALPQAPIIADSAEPKSIAELRQQGLNVIPCEKGKDSVSFGIKNVQGQRISYTRSSTNLHNEYENYAWKINKDGENVGIEDPKCANHLMSAARYGLSMFAGEGSMYDPDKAVRAAAQANENRRQSVSTVQADAGL